MPFIYSTTPSSLPLHRKPSTTTSSLHHAGAKLHSALTRHYHSRAAHCSRPRPSIPHDPTTTTTPIPEPETTSGSVCGWVVVAHADEEEQEEGEEEDDDDDGESESDEEFALRMAREREQEREREGEMFVLQMLLWRRWGRPRFEEEEEESEE